MDRPAIRSAGLRKQFGALVAVDGIDLEVPAGTVVGMLGPNGAGKTTMVRMLTTVLRPDGGRAEVLGLDVAAQSEAVRAVIGLAGQFAAVDENLTGRENLRIIGRLTHLARSTTKARADELLERFTLAEAADRLVKTYSGGMRRRLDVAAALVHKPSVLFLDEPTTGLDPRTRADLWEMIAELVADGTTLLLCTQYLEEADRLADDIVVIDHGRIIAQGSAAELKARLGSTIVEVTFGRADDATRAAGLLGSIGPAETVDAGLRVAVRVTDGAAALLQAVRLLDEAGVEPSGLGVREPSLDDVFLELTGRSTDDRPSTPAPPPAMATGRTA
jgi:ABC-2 type transport system ATP-binding protein